MGCRIVHNPSRSEPIVNAAVGDHTETSPELLRTSQSSPDSQTPTRFCTTVDNKVQHSHNLAPASCCLVPSAPDIPRGSLHFPRSLPSLVLSPISSRDSPARNHGDLPPAHPCRRIHCPVHRIGGRVVQGRVQELRLQPPQRLRDLRRHRRQQLRRLPHQVPQVPLHHAHLLQWQVRRQVRRRLEGLQRQPPARRLRGEREERRQQLWHLRRQVRLRREVRERQVQERVQARVEGLQQGRRVRGGLRQRREQLWRV